MLSLWNLYICTHELVALCIDEILLDTRNLTIGNKVHT
jgi:hypothetical protein